MSSAIKWAHLEVVHKPRCMQMLQMPEEDSGEQKHFCPNINSD